MDIIAFWDKQWRVWVVIVTDMQGNQIWDCQYFMNRKHLQQAWS